MKKWFVFFYAFLTVVLVSFSILYSVKLDKAKKEEVKKGEIKKELDIIYKYIESNKIKNTIKLVNSDTGEIRELKVSEYLKGVLPAEMPPEYDIEALKAQAVVARTYLYQKMNAGAHGKADICDSAAHCQAYYSLDRLFDIWKKSKGYSQQECEYYFEKVSKAVEETENIVVTYNGDYIRAYFHACSGGKTENVSAIWGKQNIPYLKSVESKGEEGYKLYNSKVKFSISELQERVNSKSDIKCNIDITQNEYIKVLSYTDTGRADKVKIGNSIYSAEQLRTILGLRSTNFTIEKEDNSVIFNVTGNGHGVGMSQVGANYYAKNGYTYGEIITHYYTGVNITYLYEEDKTNENKI